jgi:CheY-like chemotaxis protein
MPYVLIVDDVPDNSEPIQIFLGRHDFETKSVRNGVEALAELGARVPDAVVLDYRMPAMDGITLLEVMRSYLRWRTVPVVLISAYASEQDRERAKVLGACCTLKRPMQTMEPLLECLRKALSGRGG